MAKQLQLRRGTTAQHATFTGAVGEVTIDTDKDVVVVHDGATAGGFPSQKQLVSGTNIKTINDTSLLGSGNISIGVSSLSDTSISSPLSGQVLSYDGVNWANVTFSALPSQSGQSGKFLTTDGSTATWETIDALPSQTGNAGKFLTTDGTTASWGGLPLNGTSSRNTYTATAGQTTFSSTYDVGYVDVYRNGLKLAPSDFTATNGTTVVLNNACSLNDVVDIVAYGTFELADAYTKNDADVLLAAKQPTLVSGTNIKTIGGVSILGSGDIFISLPISLPTKVAYNQISVDGITLTLTSPTAGTDYYFSKTSITTSIQSDTIGGFHYGLTPSGETPTGNKTSADITAIAGINAYSIWTNWHRPNCDPRGMVKVGDIWVDIYLADSRYGIRKYSAPTSITGYKIAGGATTYGREIPIIPTEFGGNGSSNYGKLTWFQVNEIAKASGKRSLRYSEFPSAMYGVLEQTDSSSYDGGGGNIFHIAQLTSKFGIEQATGTQWVWGDDVQGIGSDGWKTGLTDSRGSIYAYTNQPTAVLLGGARVNGSDAGSRCSFWLFYVWNSDWAFGCRFACDHLKLV